MDRPVRTVAKAISWQALGLITMTAITYAITGSVAEGGLIAVVGAITGMFSFILHERVWTRISWGRSAGYHGHPGEVSSRQQS
ncbi:MAG: DUF2061 domain-containing protein [Rhodomicrobiaceae bacterium]